ncbi:MAG: hypothetical protein JRE24_09445 [Deltaproteobacteria bacterium]|nr:hypothetical protein [Deltaproteobacteria bacterium]
MADLIASHFHMPDMAALSTSLSAFAEDHGLQYATARCRPEAEADNRVVAEGEDGYFSGTTGLPVGLHPVQGRSNPYKGIASLRPVFW